MPTLVESLLLTSLRAAPGWMLLGCVSFGALLGAAGMMLGRRRARREAEPAGEGATTQPPEAQRDPLTGFVVRNDFDAALEEAAWQFDHCGGAPLTVLSVGVDDLRGVNDAFGVSAGDALLAQLARRLHRLVDDADGPTALVARISGEEFAVVLASEETGAVDLAARICSALARPLDAGGQSVGSTVSIGLACYPTHGAWSRLLSHATAAMRHVRQGGGNGHAVYTPAMAVDLREQALLLQDLRLAVERGELTLLYQPKIDARSLQVTAAEALLRWQHPVRGIISPAVFVPLAERHGLIGPIGEWVVAEACRQAAAWRESGLRMRIAINISGHQLRHDRFVAHLEQEVRRHGIAPSRLTCEITESVAMEDTAQTRLAFQRLRRAGFHVSIDDFGTGHSSLAILRRLPAAELKVDRSFIVDLEVSESARSIVEAVLGVARTLGLRVVAEGVETSGQRDILMRLGCDELQGYLFAKPMSAVALGLWAHGGDPHDGAMGTGDLAQPTPAAAFRPSLFDATDRAPITG